MEKIKGKLQLICPTKIGQIINKSLNELVSFMKEDSFENLTASAKTILGTKIEKEFLTIMKLPCKKGKNKDWLLDTIIDGIDVDIKCTIGNNWMMPPEVIGHWCILFQIDAIKKKYSLGFLKADIKNLNGGLNRDRKRSISKTGRANIEWLVFAENF